MGDAPMNATSATEVVDYLEKSVVYLADLVNRVDARMTYLMANGNNEDIVMHQSKQLRILSTKLLDASCDIRLAMYNFEEEIVRNSIDGNNDPLLERLAKVMDGFNTCHELLDMYRITLQENVVSGKPHMYVPHLAT